MGVGLCNAVSALEQYNLKCNRIIHLCYSWFRPCGYEFGKAHMTSALGGGGGLQTADEKPRLFEFCLRQGGGGLKI